MIAAGLDPIKQFEIKKLAELKVGNFDISFTNSSLMMVVCVACVAVWLMLHWLRRLEKRIYLFKAILALRCANRDQTFRLSSRNHFIYFASH